MDYKNSYNRLTIAEKNDLYKYCKLFHFQRLLDGGAFLLMDEKGMFLKVNHELPGDIQFENGTTYHVTTVYNVPMSWLERYYIIPMSHEIKPWDQELFGCTESIPSCLCGFLFPGCYVWQIIGFILKSFV